MRAHNGDRCPVAFALELSLSVCLAAQGQNRARGPPEPAAGTPWTKTTERAGSRTDGDVLRLRRSDQGTGRTHPSPLSSGWLPPQQRQKGPQLAQRDLGDDAG